MAVISSILIDGPFRVEQRTITPAEVTSKKIRLSSKPNPSNLVLDIVGGVTQAAGSDFRIDAEFISWDGLQLEDLVEQGDVFRIVYQKKN